MPYFRVCCCQMQSMKWEGRLLISGQRHRRPQGVVSGLVWGQAKNSNPDPIPVNTLYLLYWCRVCNGFAMGLSAGAGFQ
jgi:hypothetical protein